MPNFVCVEGGATVSGAAPSSDVILSNCESRPSLPANLRKKPTKGRKPSQENPRDMELEPTLIPALSLNLQLCNLWSFLLLKPIWLEFAVPFLKQKWYSCVTETKRGENFYRKWCRVLSDAQRPGDKGPEMYPKNLLSWGGSSVGQSPDCSKW